MNLSRMALMILAFGTVAVVVGCGDSSDSSTGRSRITRIEITSKVSPAYEGKMFGGAGQYELLVGKVYGEADPNSEFNGPVTDLKGAPRNANGMVEYSADVQILKPLDLAKANGTLFYEVTNRGNKSLLTNNLMGGSPTFTTAAAAGKGLGLDRGYVMVWTGWQTDVASTQTATGTGAMAATFPVARNADGSSITGYTVEDLALDGVAATVIAPAANATAFDAPLSYPSVDQDVSKLQLTVQEHATDPITTLGPASMKFIDERTVRVQMAPGFDLGAIYRLTYKAKDPTVAGLSFVSIRDLISFLRYSGSSDNPLAVSGKSIVTRTMATGMSQSGRYLKDFLYRGFNGDEQGRVVFDGMVPSGSGGKRGFFAQRWAQPGRSPDLQHEHRNFPGAQFPFTYPVLSDPITGMRDGILAKCLANKTCPKVMQTDAEWEQWQQAGSLVMTDPLGAPIELPDNVRSYVFSGAQHGASGSVAAGTFPANARVCENTGNPLDWSPLWRALVVDLEEWITSGTLPPATSNPVASQRRSIDQLAAAYPAIPNLRFSKVYGNLQLIDFSAEPQKLISANPEYAQTFLRMDSDGNAIDGTLMPEMTVPIATYSGRTTRAANYAQGDLCATFGAAFPFARTAQERVATGDPRPSIAERYASEAEYRSRLQAAAAALVAQRRMLPADAAVYSTFVLPK